MHDGLGQGGGWRVGVGGEKVSRMWVLGWGGFAESSGLYLHRRAKRHKVNTYDMRACKSTQVSLSILSASNSLDDTVPSAAASCSSSSLRTREYQTLLKWQNAYCRSHISRRRGAKPVSGWRRVSRSSLFAWHSDKTCAHEA